MASPEVVEGLFRNLDGYTTAYKMVRMRNRLVHLYWEVDAEILHDTLQHNLGDFDRFKAFVLRFLQSQDGSSLQEL